jgi:hypothetical protein
MIKEYCLIVTFIYFGLSQSVFAQSDSEQEKQRCSESTLNLVGKHLALSDFSYPRDSIYPSAKNGGMIVAGVCKAWPRNTAITIAAFAYDDKLVVAMVDNLKSKVNATYEVDLMDFAGLGVDENGLRIDTARYDLAPSVRAFGIDVTERYNPGCHEGGHGAIRTLFVQDGKKIKPILENFITSSWRFANNDLTCIIEDAEKETEDFSYSIGISKVTTNGYANLLITAISSQSSRKPFYYELQYDGKEYPNNSQYSAEIDKWRNAP